MIGLVITLFSANPVFENVETKTLSSLSVHEPIIILQNIQLEELYVALWSMLAFCFYASWAHTVYGQVELTKCENSSPE